jgi:hypothetical protein
MRRNTTDKTIERNYQQKWIFLIEEYLLTKSGKHPRFRFVSDFYKSHRISRQTFCKYYGRYRNSGDLGLLLPQKRGPRWQARRPDASIEVAVLQQRKLGLNRYEVHAVLSKELKDKTPSPSGIYNIFKRNGMNKRSMKQKEEKRSIIKERAGQMGHIDCHYLSKDLILNQSKRQYLVCIIDDFSRIAWAEVVDDIKSLTVMFTSLKTINFLFAHYKIQFEEILSDNGSEFSSRSERSKLEHPFERMLLELGIKHRYTRPYRPQTNGKVERFWRTLNEDLIEGTTFETLDEFKDELEKYMLYYNEIRPHQSLAGKNPKQFLEENLSMN